MTTTRDGDAQHIAMKGIRMREGKSISPINTYAKQNKQWLYIKNRLLPFHQASSRLCGHLNYK